MEMGAMGLMGPMGAGGVMDEQEQRVRTAE